ncbi:hypothetical protein ACEU6E_10935 (plasmid) [Halorutilales archaeon Cl-col2-1]
MEPLKSLNEEERQRLEGVFERALEELEVGEVETALDRQMSLKQYYNNHKSNRGKVEPFLEELREITERYGKDNPRREMDIISLFLKTEMSRPTYYKLRDRAEEELGVDLEEYRKEVPTNDWATWQG